MHPLVPTQPREPLINKCAVARGSLPAHIDPRQPPTKGKPLATLAHLRWCHQIDLLLPTELAQTVHQHLNTSNSRDDKPFRYAKLHASLLDILSNPFFSTYIKRHTVCMRSEGRPLADPIYSLDEGELTLQLPADLYKRTGLQGKVVPDGGRKHAKSQYEVSVDLRAPSMVHGKKGFERLVWAARNVLSESRKWVFAEVSREKPKSGDEGAAVQPSSATTSDTGAIAGGSKDQADGQAASATVGTEEPIEKYHPLWCEVKPSEHIMKGVVIPGTLESDIWQLNPPARASKRKRNDTSLDYDAAEELEEVLEYLSLAGLDSSRLKADDKVDPYISRYGVPGGIERSRKGSLTRLRWQGFLHCESFILPLVLAVKKALETHSESEAIIDQTWTASTMHGIEGEAVSLLLKRETTTAVAPAEHGGANNDVQTNDEANDGDSDSLDVDGAVIGTQVVSQASKKDADNIARQGEKGRKQKGPKLGSVGFIEWIHQTY